MTDEHDRRPFPFAGVIFDLDGTLVDSGLDFQVIRRELGLGPEPILETLALLPPERRRACEEVLHRHEYAGAMRATVLAGAREWMAFLDAAGIPRAIFTRNARSIVRLTLERCSLLFNDIIAREDAPPKPDPAGIHELCRRWRTTPRDVLVVGDYLYDIQAGQNAGAPTALVTQGRSWDFSHQADYCWNTLVQGLAHWHGA
jgi:HAD superfamily hydrolase (TIGR01509 family)